MPCLQDDIASLNLTVNLHIATAVDKTVMIEFAMMSSSRRSGKASEAMSLRARQFERSRMIFGG